MRPGLSRHWKGFETIIEGGTDMISVTALTFEMTKDLIPGLGIGRNECDGRPVIVCDYPSGLLQA